MRRRHQPRRPSWNTWRPGEHRLCAPGLGRAAVRAKPEVTELVIGAALLGVAALTLPKGTQSDGPLDSLLGWGIPAALVAVGGYVVADALGLV